MLMATIVALLIGIVTFRYAMFTIGRFQLIAWFGLLSIVIAVFIWAGMRSHFKPVLSKIVQGERRIAALAAEIAFCIAVVLSTGGLMLNRHFPSDRVRQIDAIVISASKVSGPKIWGWDMTVDIEGRSHYQMISHASYQTVSRAKKVRLTLRRGLLGLEWIEGLAAADESSANR
jgi:hypothetical protein